MFYATVLSEVGQSSRKGRKRKFMPVRQTVFYTFVTPFYTSDTPVAFFVNLSVSYILNSSFPFVIMVSEHWEDAVCRVKRSIKKVQRYF